MFVSNKLTELQIDALREISNIGLGHAVTSLAEMLEGKIGMDVPHANFISMEEVIEILGGYEELVSCVSLELDGDIQGSVFYIFNKSSTYKLVDTLMGFESEITNGLDDMAISTINEIGNILTGSFISAISDFTNLKIIPSPPIFAFDMLAAIFTSLIIVSGQPEGENILTIKTEMYRDDRIIKGFFFLMPDPESYEKLFFALGVGD